MRGDSIQLSFVGAEEGVYEVISTSTAPWCGRWIVKPEPSLLTPPSLGVISPLPIYLRFAPNFIKGRSPHDS